MGSIGVPINSHDVVIVGAGPVGLALALDLGRRGIRSVVFERKPATGAEIEAKASVLNERTMEFCRLLGVRDEVANAGYPKDIPGDTVYCTALHDKLIGRLEMSSYNERSLPEQSSEMLQRCPQCWFDPVLARAVLRQGMARLVYGVEVTGCAQTNDYATCSIKYLVDGKTENFTTRYLVACDGPSSLVRKAVGIAFEGKDLGHTLSAVIETDINSPQAPFGRAAERYMFIGPDGTWGNFTTIDGRSLWRFSLVNMERKVEKDNFDLHPLVVKAFGRVDADYQLKRVLQWRRSQYTAESYKAGRILLAGDAAHTMSPTGGHGLNTGLGDASDLSWMLEAMLKGWGGDSLLDAYQIERRPIALRNGAGSTKNFAVWKEGQGRDKVLDDGPEADEHRRLIGERMAASMRQEFQAIGLSLGYDYSQSPLIVPDGSPAPPNEPEVYIQTARPGHRAPHCWLKNGRSIIDMFGTEFVLLCFGIEAPEDREILDLAVKLHVPVKYANFTRNDLVALYERRLVLVRPDGMVAWRGDVLPSNVEGLLNTVRGVSTSVAV